MIQLSAVNQDHADAEIGNATKAASVTTQPCKWLDFHSAGLLNLPLTQTKEVAGRISQGVNMSDTTDTVGVAGDRIRSIIERIERLDEEIKDLMETKKEIFGEAKGEGLYVKVLKEILKLRKQDKDERDEQETLLDLYLRAMDAPTTAPVAQAA